MADRSNGRLRAWGLTLVVAGVVAGVGVLLLAGVVSHLDLSDEVFPRVPPGHLAVLLRKEGREPPPESVIAPRIGPGEEPYRGVQEEVLPPGWYPTGYDPYHWAFEIVPQTVVPSSQVGVLVRLFGEDLPAGRIFADEDPADEAAGRVYKGVLQRTLEPGSHLVNTRAYEVILVPRVLIESGQVGVVTRRAGPLPADRDAFLSASGERGVQAEILPPGSHTVNPFLQHVLPVSRQSQRLDLSEVARGVRFATSDGFEIGLNGTVEWSLPEARVPLVYVKFGRTDEVSRKLVLPAASAISQSLGALQPAREFITGATLLSFQSGFETDLRALIDAEGPRVQSALVSKTVPPTELAAPIKARENSENLRAQFEKEMETELARVGFVGQTELENRAEQIPKMESDLIKKRSKAEGQRSFRRIEAESELEKARLQRQMAETQAEQVLAEARALAEAAARKGEVEAALLAARIAAHGGGRAYARTVLLEKVAPRYRSILENTDGPLAGIFRRFETEEE